MFSNTIYKIAVVLGLLALGACGGGDTASSSSGSNAGGGGNSGSADTTAPVISDVSVTNITQTSAIVSWTTNENSSSQVQYGTTASYGAVVNGALNVTNHSVPLSGLTANTSYNYRVSSADSAGNAAMSSGATFVTIVTAPTGSCESIGYSTEKFNLTAPYCLDMRDDDYLRYPVGNPVAIANGNASVTDEPAGSFNGGHTAKIVPPTTELYAGLGNFNFLPGSVGNRMNIRYLVYWGYDAVQSGVKLNIMNDGVSTRPMVISREMRTGQNTTYPHDYMIPIPSQNVNEAPTIRDSGYPNNPSYFIAGAEATVAEGNYAHQWVCWEFEIITGGNAPILNFYVHTRDGIIAYGPGNPYATHAWDAGVIDLVRASVGWYWGPGWIQSSESYVKISDVVISNTYIGPPAGFVQ